MATMKEQIYAQKLHDAICANDVGSLKNLLARGANPDTCYGDKYSSNAKSILHLACGKGHTECVKALLEAGAMPDIHDKWGQMPLKYCLCSDFFDTADVLLDHAGDKASEIVNSKEGAMYLTCLNVMAGRGCVDGIQLLLRYGADVNDTDYHGMTPLMSCLGTPNHALKQTINLPAIKLLVEAGTDLEIRDRHGITALQRAVMELNVEAVEYLLSVGANVNSEDFTGKTPITNILDRHRIFEENIGSGDNMAVLLMLIQAGANLNRTTREGNVLMTCLREPSLSAQFIHLFLREGANPDVCVQGERPLLVAIGARDLYSTCALLEFNASLRTDNSVGSTTSAAMDLVLNRRMLDFACLLLLAGDETWRDRSKSEELSLAE